MGSDKKKKHLQDVKTKKLTIIFGSIIGTIIIIVAAILIINGISDHNERQKYFGASLYTRTTSYMDETGSHNNTEDLLKDYDYYRIYLSDNSNRFTLRYKIKDNDKVYTYTGRYEKTDSTLRLQYSSFIEEGSDWIEYTIEEDGSWSRNQFMNIPGMSSFTVVQKFEQGLK